MMVLLWLPMIIFFLVYGLLCGVGSLFLLWHIEPITSIYTQHTGVVLPQLSQNERLIFILIFAGGPLFFMIWV